ncbi:MAG: DNA-binding protein [Anaerolineae bacterium]|nr:DNA-binding protein [Anaerolineae bacterium]
MTHKIDPKRGGFPPNLSQPALRALENAGYHNLNQLTAITEKDLLALHGMGAKGIRLLREALAERGLSFAQPQPKK